MSKTYRPYEPDQLFLMPPSLTDWLPADHMVYFVREILDQIDLAPIVSVYEDEERGQPPYHPKAMTGILLYGYSNGIFSSRKLEKHCQEDVAFRVLAANNQPDHRTINDFRKLHLDALEHVFIEVLQLCRKTGLVKFGHISLDGTKIKANASKHKAMSYGRMKEETKRLRKEISHLLQQAKAIDEQEDLRYGKDKRRDELPEELTHRETRLARIREAKRALEQEAKEQSSEQDDKPSSDQQIPMAKVKTELNRKTGKEEIADKAQRNFTDPESRIMPYQKTFVQGYNAQVAVDSKHQIIVATELTNNPTDDELLPAMIARLPKKPKAFSADAGYSVTDNNIKYLNKKRIDAYIAIKGEKHDRLIGQVRSPRGPIPRNLTIKERMKRKLRTVRGRRLYAKRKCIAEPPIGQIKHAQGFRQFSLRGYAKSRAEWFLVTATHNLRKLFRACSDQPRRRKLLFAG